MRKVTGGVLACGLAVAGACAALAEPTAVASEVKVSSFGYDPEDSTRFIQAALDSGARRVVFDRQEGPWVTRPVFVRSDTEVVFEPKTVLQAKRGEFMGLRDYLFSVCNVTNVTLRGGAGSAFRMWRDDYVKPPYPKGDWRYTLSIRAASNVLVEGLRFERSGGDGVCVAVNSQNVTIRRCVCDENPRQGLTIGSGENVLVEDCVFSNTRGAFPQAGVDIEPDVASHNLVNVVLRNCLSVGNAGSGYEIAPNGLTTNSRPVSVTLENCRAVDNATGVTFYGAWKRTSNYAQGRVLVKGCLMERSRNLGIHVSTKPATMLDLVFEDCVISNSASAVQPDVELGCRAMEQPVADGIAFRNLKVYRCQPSEWFICSCLGTGPMPANIIGDVTVTRADGSVERVVLDEAWRTRNLPVINGGKPLAPLGRFRPTTDVTVRDELPGRPVELAPVSLCFDTPFLFFADRPGPVTFTAQQVIAVAGRPPSTNAYEIAELAADGSEARKWTVGPVGREIGEIAFTAPHRGFYRLKVVSRGTRIRLATSTVPVAVDLTAGDRTFGAYQAQPFSVWFETSSAPSPTFLLKGSSYNRFDAALTDPSGTVVSSEDCVATVRTVALKPAAGLWRCDFSAARQPAYDWVVVSASQAPQCLFLSPRKCWLGR